MSARKYDQFCLMSQSLDVVGNRWSLLVVRELFLGPRRFSDIVSGLGTASTDIVTTRLRELEASQVIARDDDRRYRLTESGLRLAPVLFDLSRWVAQHLAEGHTQLPEPTGDVGRRLMTLLALKSRRVEFSPNSAQFDLATDTLAAIAVRAGEHYVITESEGDADEAIVFAGDALVPIGIGGADIDALLDGGALQVPSEAARRFVIELNQPLGDAADVPIG